ncbi:uncharacterized protein LOC109714089 [Ananas comosus]|uniref:Uncharacterized protein LOC109714089 n=1 Tax=Ananas comosus TaxID=4615 RepID=A0A6P5FL01_ANACO|nr:uncharacterized protein LOC109714089 [Ananas comosus]
MSCARSNKMVKSVSKTASSSSSTPAAASLTVLLYSTPNPRANEVSHLDTGKSSAANDKMESPKRDPALPLTRGEILQIKVSCGIINKGAESSMAQTSVVLLPSPVQKKVDGEIFQITNVYDPIGNTPKFPSRSLDVFVISLEACGPLGNFNVLFSLRDKNGSSSNISDILLFRETVNDIGLIDLPLLNKSYTWSNGRRTPTLERLDRAFISHDWVRDFLASLFNHVCGRIKCVVLYSFDH